MVYCSALIMSLNTPDKKLNYSPSCHNTPNKKLNYSPSCHFNPARHGEHNWRYFWWNLSVTPL